VSAPADQVLILGGAHLRQIPSCHAAYYNEVEPRAGAVRATGSS